MAVDLGTVAVRSSRTPFSRLTFLRFRRLLARVSLRTEQHVARTSDAFLSRDGVSDENGSALADARRRLPPRSSRTAPDRPGRTGAKNDGTRIDGVLAGLALKSHAFVSVFQQVLATLDLAVTTKRRTCAIVRGGCYREDGHCRRY